MSATDKGSYRVYRATVYVGFVVLIVFLSSLPLMAVVQGLIANAKAEAPPREPIVKSAPETPLTQEEAENCLEAFDSLRKEIEKSFSGLGSLIGKEGRDALQMWTEKSRVWETTRASLAKECKAQDPDADQIAQTLAPIADSLEITIRAYNRHATRFVLEDGASFRRLSKAFDRAAKTIR